MNLAIMQPYFFAYIGYYQLIKSVDVFVIYDNIEFTKKGWFSRNRILMNGNEKLFTIPLKKDSDFLHVDKRFLSDDSLKARKKILSQISNSYKSAPYFDITFDFIERIFLHEDDNLFNFIKNSVIEICNYLEIETKLINASDVDADHSLKSKNKVLEYCKNLKCDRYINAIGGQELYDSIDFKNSGIDLKFIEMNPITYKQFNNEFVPNLSIIDVLMFNSKEEVQKMLDNYKLV